jgi:hypothetical protein
MLFICHNPHPRDPGRPSTFEMLRTIECAPTLCPSIAFTFGFIVEYIQEFWGVSLMLAQFLQGNWTMANMNKPKICLILLRILKIGSFIYRNAIQNNSTMDELKEIK